MIQLSFYDNHNVNNFGIEHQRLHFEHKDGKYFRQIDRYGDTVFISNLYLEHNQNIDLSISFSIGPFTLIEIPSKIFIDNYIYNYDDEIIINPMLDIFLGEILLNKSFFDYKISIETNEHIEQIDAICKYLCYEDTRRNQLMNEEHYVYKTIEKFNYEHTLAQNKFIFNGITQGFILYSHSPIKKLVLKYNNMVLQEYNDILLEIYAERLNKNTIYVPFVTNNKLTDNNINSLPDLTVFKEGIVIEIDTDDNVEIYQVKYQIISSDQLNIIPVNVTHGMIVDKKMIGKSFIIKPYSKKLEDNTECMITKCTINEGDYYWGCDKCVCVCDYEMAEEWFRMSNKCPYCNRLVDTRNLIKITNI